jgi:4-hydroxy-3-methylbut-2-enyl diphosphate reductase IspH
MSVKTRIEALEKRLAKPEREETVIHVREIIVHNREEVEQLRAAGLMDSPRDNNQPIPRGPVRIVIEEAVDAKDLLARAVQEQDSGPMESQEGRNATES